MNPPLITDLTHRIQETTLSHAPRQVFDGRQEDLAVE
jgi:hypothetical protein